MKQNKQFQIQIQNSIQNKKIRHLIARLNIMYVKSNEKVAYYYEDINKGIILSFNADTTFYAASTIKILAVLYLFNQKEDLEKTIKIEPNDIKQGCGRIKFETLPKEYSLKELIYYCLKYSDNTAYLKLVNYIGKEKLQDFGLKIGAKHPLEGKDSFGITTCQDMKIFWEHLVPYIKEDKELQEILENPEYQIINWTKRNGKFLRKYGSFDIAYHECGIVIEEHPFYLMVLTQKSNSKSGKRFINKTAKQIIKIHKEIQRIEE